MSDTFTVHRSTSIDAPLANIYRHIVDLHRMGEWSPWEEIDPAMEKTYSGAESGVTARYEWNGNRKVGRGSLEITDAKENERVEMALEFLKPFKASNTTSFALQPRGDATTVTWSMTGRNTLMTRVIGIFKSMDAMVGPDFERGLAKLKSLVEARS
ncbi:MAG: SRPBCC family protein [Acidimicrobiia bacterium]|nr:SRPBCC family protein [Acidimicrobiia bacterium]NNF09076.1 SRPBCC family protein [Acidimicrobiia bacterium]NNL71278.1 SRPBCC family protein [Acidimicrobiia bacterium]